MNLFTEGVGAFVVYISTDYVFDGSSPPYQVTDEPNPLNKYGRSKLDGEIAALAVDSGMILLVYCLCSKTGLQGQSRDTATRGHPAFMGHFLRMLSYLPHVKELGMKGHLSSKDIYSQILRCPLNTGFTVGFSWYRYANTTGLGSFIQASGIKVFCIFTFLKYWL